MCWQALEIRRLVSGRQRWPRQVTVPEVLSSSPEQRFAQCRFTRAAFPYQAEHFALGNVQRHAIDRAQHAFAGNSKYLVRRCTSTRWLVTASTGPRAPAAPPDVAANNAIGAAAQRRGGQIEQRRRENSHTVIACGQRAK